MDRSRPRGIPIVALLMILFGLAEMVTGFTHNFLGIISTDSGAVSTYAAAGIGALYAVGGLLILTMKKRAAGLALVCLVAVIVGRICLVLTGLYPVNSFLQIFSIIVGTGIVIFFAVYVGLKWSAYRK